jgi:hypothetical protein
MSSQSVDSQPRKRPAVASQASPCDELVIRSQPADVERPCPRKRLALAATILGSSMAFIDGSVVNVALPSIQGELGASIAAMQWVVNAYLLFLGALVLVGGAMGDKLGRRKVFVAASRSSRRRPPHAGSRPAWAGSSARARCRASAPRCSCRAACRC